ncbi:MAG: DUF2723 domain-containing protein, partial [Deltaproteobacteria bacterium]|nr:DUF2723 domain-containing protein [Deltaproteobacteria bacterium]
PWIQSVNAEVYTLNLFMNLTAFYMLISGHGDSRRAIAAFFIFGLSLANHHYLTLLTAPALAFILVFGEYKGKRALVSKGFAFLVAALFVYAYLPARGARTPEISWGDTTTLQGFVDQVSARIFTASLGGFEKLNVSFTDNIASAVSLFLETYSIWVFPFFLAGIFIFLKHRSADAFAAFLLLAGAFLSKVIMGILDAKNLDDYGYFLASGAMIMFFSGVSAVEIAGWVGKNTGARVSVVFICLFVALFVFLSTDRARYSLARGADKGNFYSAELFSEARLNPLPGGSILFAWYYPVYFMDMYSRAVSGFRSDAGIVQQSLYHKVGGDFYVKALKEKYPELSKAFNRYLDTKYFPADELIKMSWKSPLFFDISADLKFPEENLSSAGFVHRIVPAVSETEAEILQKIVNIYSGFQRKAGEYFNLDYETRRILLLKHIQNAKYFFKNGFVEAAVLETSLAAKANPFEEDPRELKELKAKSAQRKEDGL